MKIPKIQTKSCIENKNRIKCKDDVSSKENLEIRIKGNATKHTILQIILTIKQWLFIQK